MGLIDFLTRRTQRAYVQMMGGGLAGDFRQDAYKNAVVRECVDAIARHTAKLNAVHMREGKRVSDEMGYVLAIRANPYMSAYDFQYKITAQALMKNNAFALPVWDKKGALTALLPVEYTCCEALEDAATGDAYIRFDLVNGKQTILPHAELIHIRRHYNRGVLVGDDNGPLNDAVEMVNVANAGTMSAVKSGSSLRGILKLKQALLKDKDIRQRRDDFIRDYIGSETGGIAGMDASMEYVQLDPSKMYSLTTEQMGQIRGNVYRYFGVSEKFVRGDCTEDEWNAAYEAVIEPFALQFHLEYTHVLFTSLEREAGESVQFEANRLQYASARTKVELVNKLGMLGLITYNEGREIFNMPPLPEGNRLIPPWNNASDKNGGNAENPTKPIQLQGVETAE